MAIPDLLDTWNRLTDAIYYGNDVASGTLVPTSRTISTTAPITGGGDLSANRTIGITLTGGGTGAVGTGRTIATTAPLTGGGTLAADLTLALTTTPVGQTPVGSGRTITTTTPLKIDGGASANLTADRTLSVIPFTGALDGIVTHNPSGVQGKYLKDDNTWGTSATAGVSDITATAPLTASASTGSVVLDIADAAILTDGIVPATGGADATKFLSATNPLSWAVPGLGTYVRLQASTPGTADVGSLHVDGSAIVEDAATVGAAATLGTGVVEALSGSALDSFVGRASHTTGTPILHQQRSRGTLAAPTATTDNDVLGGLYATGYSTSGAWSGSISAGLFVKADGNAVATRQPSYTDMIGGDTTNFSQVRMTGTGLRLQSAMSSISNSARAVSTMDVIGTLGLKPTAKTTSFSAGEAESLYLCDCTGINPLIATLPTAVGKLGRVYGFTKVDTTFKKLQILTTGGQTIAGQAAWEINVPGAFLIVVSDNANWYMFSGVLDDGWVAAANGSAVHTTAAETTLITLSTSWNAYLLGMDSTAQFAGKLSTTGAPTLRFKVKNTGDFVVADSGAVTMPSGVTDVAWQVTYEASGRTVAVARVVTARLYVSQTAGVGAAMNTYNMYDVSQPSVLTPEPTYMTVQWGTSSASNTVTCLHASVRYNRHNLVS